MVIPEAITESLNSDPTPREIAKLLVVGGLSVGAATVISGNIYKNYIRSEAHDKASFTDKGKFQKGVGPGNDLYLLTKRGEGVEGLREFFVELVKRYTPNKDSVPTPDALRAALTVDGAKGFISERVQDVKHAPRAVARLSRYGAGRVGAGASAVASGAGDFINYLKTKTKRQQQEEVAAEKQEEAKVDIQEKLTEGQRTPISTWAGEYLQKIPNPSDRMRKKSENARRVQSWYDGPRDVRPKGVRGDFDAREYEPVPRKSNRETAKVAVGDIITKGLSSQRRSRSTRRNKYRSRSTRRKNYRSRSTRRKSYRSRRRSRKYASRSRRSYSKSRYRSRRRRRSPRTARRRY